MHKNMMNLIAYLNDGAGKAWAGQSNTRLFPISFSKMKPLESEEKAGALDPTGST